MKALAIKFSGDRCLSCRTCELACAVAHSSSDGVNDAVREATKPISRLQIVLKKDRTHLLRCMHCKKPKCVEVCKSWAKGVLVSHGSAEASGDAYLTEVKVAPI